MWLVMGSRVLQVGYGASDEGWRGSEIGRLAGFGGRTGYSSAGARATDGA